MFVNFTIYFLLEIEIMLKKILAVGLTCAVMLFSGCQRVEPNQAGVLMTNYGKKGKADFQIVSGKVYTLWAGTELYTIPLFDQRSAFDKNVILKSADSTEFVVKPIYSYRVIKDRAIDVVFDNKQAMTGDDGKMKSIEENILNPRIVDILRTSLLNQKSTDLMGEGGNRNFNELIRKQVNEEFSKRGFELITFSAMLDYSAEVKDIIDQRNQSNTSLETIESDIKKARRKLELEKINTEIALIKSEGLTKEILQEQFIKKWDGKSPLYYGSPATHIMK